MDGTRIRRIERIFTDFFLKENPKNPLNPPDPRSIVLS